MTERAKPTVAHYALIAFVMLSVTLGMSTFMMARENQQLAQDIKRLNDALARCEAQRAGGQNQN